MSKRSDLILPEDRMPIVIDKELIWKHLKPRDGEEEFSKSVQSMSDEEKEYIVKTATTLRLEFLQILQVDNLNQFTSLTRLFLDNNFIENITGLDKLVHLTWLDLSFNRIRVIDGLTKLVNLQVLALYRNEISKIENLESLQALEVLRIGSNRISDRKDIVYLRGLQSLRTLSLKGNPFCQTADWYGFVVALLPRLSYLDCKTITQSERQQAMTRFQGDILRAESKEERDRDAREKLRSEQEAEQRHRAAFVDNILDGLLYREMVTRNPQNEAIILNHGRDHGIETLRSQFEAAITEIGNQLFELGLEYLDLRERETRELRECMKAAQKNTQQKGIRRVEIFLKEKDTLFETLNDMAQELEDKDEEEIEEFQREDIEKTRERFRAATKDLWNSVMEQELVLVNQMETVLKIFEKNIDTMLLTFLNSAKGLLKQARSEDVRYYHRLCELAEKRSEEGKLGRIDDDESEDKLLSVIASCHDDHQQVLLDRESRLEHLVETWKRHCIKDLKLKERERNRARVLELNHFLDVVRQEEQDIEVIPSQTIDEDI